MQLGSFTIEVLSEGQFEIFGDGHINRSSPIAQTSDSNPEIAESTSAQVGINPILIKTGPYNILLDAGLGWGLDAGSNYDDVSNVCTNLEIFELEPEDITHVILSHLHYDHAAGCSFTGGDFTTKATFPNATYFVHEEEWEYALSQVDKESDKKGADYELDDFYKLVADQKVELLSGNTSTILDNISTIRTGGHTPGHQAVIINNSGELAYYLGDLLPSAFHLNNYGMSEFDIDPIEAKKRKIQLLRSAFEKEASLLFYHSLFSNIGRLEKDEEEQYVLKELE